MESVQEEEMEQGSFISPGCLPTHCRRHDGYFVDLFVRVSNAVAINMYTKVC